MKSSNYDYDEIADKIFYPIYDEIAKDIIKATGITTGQMVDLGSGGGHLGFALMKLTQLNGIFVDCLQAPLDIAKHRAVNLGLANRTITACQDVHCMNFEDGFANLIISRGSYLFWEDQEKAFKEIYRILAPGGKTYIGSGLGSENLRKSIRKKMEAMEPGWNPPGRNRNSKALSNEAYVALFKKLGYTHIINEGDCGRWIILEKIN